MKLKELTAEQQQRFVTSMYLRIQACMKGFEYQLATPSVIQEINNTLTDAVKSIAQEFGIDFAMGVDAVLEVEGSEVVLRFVDPVSEEAFKA